MGVMRWWSALLVLVLAGCTEGEPAPAEPVPVEPASAGRAPATDAERRAVEDAREAAQHLGRTVRGRLLSAMEEGPEAAARVCADEAQALTARAAEERGARVGRTSLRLRNPQNEGPAWARAWLEQQGERPAAELSPRAFIEGDVARFVAPIAVEGPCLLCHGEREGVLEPVRVILRERYPNDSATGYRVGDLRGALWAEVPVRPTP